MQKLFAYVDETGQDTEGKLFLVSVVLTSSERENVKKDLRKIEKESGKNFRKWTKSTCKQRTRYIKAIILSKNFVGKLFYSKYHDTKAYVDLTIFSTAKAVLVKAKFPYQVTVFVDGLKRSERHRFATGLRKLKVKVSKVRGIKDESDEFIRLADAIAGFVRDSLENNMAMVSLFKKAVQSKAIEKV
ncbi:MAG: DUF3800 domain-containing protein [Candidatus Cloacimonetes bacterium]|nr:DUF3800 domain-containing protein [Candidatus Cloacimonadota bacterium]